MSSDTTIDGQANDCRHLSATGVDTASLADPNKVWRCDHCGLRWTSRDGIPNMPDYDPAPFCELKAGHAGMHSDGDGHWGYGITHSPDPAADATKEGEA